MTIRVVFAKDTASFPMPHGGHLTVRKGSHWSADDPIVEQHPDLFTTDARYGLSYTVPPPELAEAPVEQATAVPGERRNTRRVVS